MRLFHKLLLAIFVCPALAHAQQGVQQQAQPCMPGMEMPGCVGRGLMMQPQTFLQEIVSHTSSGTAAEPVSTSAPMLMTVKQGWTLMFHANVFVLDEQQSSPRGRDKFFSTNWFMPMAQRKLGPGIFTSRIMLSLEPATVTGERYPLLFQEGETAFAVAIADGQHPHDFVMELAALYDLKLGEKTLLSFYFAPVGDPAIGPAPYGHRASASEDPVAPLGHHQEDSTHISDDVVTVGLARGIARLEASAFHGREPDEFRWDIDQGKIDSWSTRLTVEAGKNWSSQYSYARMKAVEALFPSEDQERMTASLMYNHPFHQGHWASTILWGRTRAVGEKARFNSYLFESTLRFHAKNYLWTRIENARRSNQLIVGENPLPPGSQEEAIGNVQAYTLGYDRDIDLVPHLASALGAQVTTYGVPEALKPIYGARPAGIAIFVRLRPTAAEK